jgi:hypothetical protein
MNIDTPVRAPAKAKSTAKKTAVKKTVTTKKPAVKAAVKKTVTTKKPATKAIEPKPSVQAVMVKVQVQGDDPHKTRAATVGELRKVLKLENTYTCTISGHPAENDRSLRVGQFVIFTKRVTHG